MEAEALLHACWDAWGDEAVLLEACRLAPLLALDRLPAWAARVRAAGMPAPCPLVAASDQVSRPLLERAAAAASAWCAFGDHEALRRLVSLAPLLEDDERSALRPLAAVVDSAPAIAAPARRVVRRTTPLATAPRPGPAVSIVVPCWNQIALTRACLRSLVATMEPQSYEIVVVDNGSSDATAELRSGDAPGLVVVRNRENLGFARACNQGLRAASFDTVILMNNDVQALAGWLAPLQRALDTEGVGAVGARLLYPDGRLQHAGVVLARSSDGALVDGMHRWHGEPGDTPCSLVASLVPAVTGAVLGIRRELLVSLGGLDEGYWNGNEDVDLCLRIWERGRLVFYEPSSCLLHHESASGAERFAKLDHNRRRLSERWRRLPPMLS